MMLGIVNYCRALAAKVTIDGENTKNCIQGIEKLMG